MSDTSDLSSPAFNLDHHYDLMRTAYRNGNYSETYRYATLIIDNGQPNTNAEAWIYKGLAAGNLSAIGSPRLSEMTDYVKRARQIDHAQQGFTDQQLAAHLSYTIFIITRNLIDQFSGTQKTQSEALAASQAQPTIVNYTNKSVGESLGAGIGAGVAQGMMHVERRDAEAKRIAISYGVQFVETYQPSIINGSEYAWSIDQSEQVAINIFETIRLILWTEAINPATKRQFATSIKPLLDTISTKQPQLDQPRLVRDTYLTCPQCGYILEKAALGCLDFVLLFVTYGLWGFVILYKMLNGPTPMKIGEGIGKTLSCKFCGHEWVNQSRSR